MNRRHRVAAVRKASATTAVKPPRISKLRLCDFRGFPGPEPVEINFDGKHLLIHGENGAGKSSLFHALDHFFSIADTTARKRIERLEEFRNLYPKATDSPCYVEVELDTGSGPLRWDNTMHPVSLNQGRSKTADTEIVAAAALRKAVFDYRALLETNFRHSDGQINLFDVTVKLLLRDYPVSGTDIPATTLFQLWCDANDLLDEHADIKRRGGDRWKAFETKLNGMITVFNDGLRQGLSALITNAVGATTNPVNEILVDLGWVGLELTDFPRIDGAIFHPEYDPTKRRIDPGWVEPKIAFHNLNFKQPHNALNEARLSALAIAMYFAGRELCTKGIASDALRLMVLDDLLIGLDLANRQPVLEMLEKRYATDWQIVLMTHDRVWFEMARQTLPANKWAAIEMYERTAPEGYPRPLIVELDTDTIASNLTKANDYHMKREYPAAALHARMALELSLKKVCEKKSIPIAYNTQLKKISSEVFLTSFKSWLKARTKSSELLIAASIAPKIANVELSRNVVLNPFSHSTPITLGDAEVKSAISAVSDFHAELKAQNLLK